MNKKLTLSIDPSIIEKAKEYVAEEGGSISGLVEDYLRKVVSRPRKSERQKALERLDKRVRSYPPFKGEIDVKEGRYEYLKEKYDL